jgi:ankyrin repeat protein
LAPPKPRFSWDQSSSQTIIALLGSLERSSPLSSSEFNLCDIEMNFQEHVIIPMLLCHCSYKGEIELTKSILDRYQSFLNTPDYSGQVIDSQLLKLQTALHAAVKGGCYEATKLLLTAGINVHARDRENRSALFHAIISDQLELIELLISNGAHPNEAEEVDIKMLIVKAASLPDTCPLECILAAGIDVSQSLASITLLDMVSIINLFIMRLLCKI